MEVTEYVPMTADWKGVLIKFRYFNCTVYCMVYISIDTWSKFNRWRNVLEVANRCVCLNVFVARASAANSTLYIHVVAERLEAILWKAALYHMCILSSYEKGNQRCIFYGPSAVLMELVALCLTALHHKVEQKNRHSRTGTHFLYEAVAYIPV